MGGGTPSCWREEWRQHLARDAVSGHVSSKTTVDTLSSPLACGCFAKKRCAMREGTLHDGRPPLCLLLTCGRRRVPTRGCPSYRSYIADMRKSKQAPGCHGQGRGHSHNRGTPLPLHAPTRPLPMARAPRRSPPRWLASTTIPLLGLLDRAARDWSACFFLTLINRSHSWRPRDFHLSSNRSPGVGGRGRVAKATDCDVSHYLGNLLLL